MRVREIKFRQPIIDKNGNFLRWHYWGFINEKFIRPEVNMMSIERAKKESQQYTGLKDKNGKEIYVDDIILIKTKQWDSEKQKNFWKKEYVLIKCNTLGNCKAYYDLDATKKWDNNGIYEDWHDYWEENDNIENVGNIFENPELLK